MRDPEVRAAFQGYPPPLSPRSLQYRFLQSTGLSHKTIQQIERARSAATLLEHGTPIGDTAFELGHFDQAHLTNALKRFIGKTPAHIYWNDEIAKFKSDETNASDTLLLGRVTYQGFAGAWPESKDEGASYFNSVRKYVVSTTLDTAEWNNSVLIKDNIVEEITKLKQQEGQDIVVHGSATLVQTLMQHDLVDRYRLLVYPVVVGKGKRLFNEGTAATLKRLEAQAFSSGVVALVYEPNRT